jgi:hypothetical protein
MTQAIDFELAGMKLKVVVDYEDRAVGGVEQVFAVGEDGKEMLVDCDTGMFYESLEGELQDAFEDYLVQEKAYYDDMRWEQAREEGRL